MHFTKKIINQFVTESKEYLETIEDDLLNLAKERNNPDPELVNKLFRIHHTIKEGAGFLNLKNILDLAFVIENIFSMTRAGEIKPEPGIIDAVMEGTNCLNTLLDDIEHSDEADISTVYNRLINLLSGEVSEEVKKELDTDLALSNLLGETIGFEINEFSWKNLTAEGKFLYVLRYDLTELAHSQNKTPLRLIRELLNEGNIIEGRLQTSLEDLHTGLPQGPLLYEVLYSTTLDPEQIQKITGLPVNRIIRVKTPEMETGNCFNTFRDFILPQIGGAKVKNDFIRIWSIGIPGGQEPYTIAVRLDEYAATCGLDGISIHDFSILATDDSPNTLAKAIIGKYSEVDIAFGPCPEKKFKYYRPNGTSWLIRDRLRSMIEFRQLNLTIPFAFPGTVDVIFYHETLTPYDRETKNKIVGKFHSILSEKGFLLPGTNAVESLKEAIPPGKFKSLKYGGTIVYKKK